MKITLGLLNEGPELNNKTNGKTMIKKSTFASRAKRVCGWCKQKTEHLEWTFEWLYEFSSKARQLHVTKYKGSNF